MRANLGPSVNLDFLDGYLFRLLQEIAARDGLEQSGLLNYYGSRIANKIGGLIEYEERLARYLLANYSDRNVVHAGMGLGTLPCALACNGMTVVGIEAYAERAKSARLLRSALIETWPEVADRYHIIEGFFPQVLTEKPASRWLPWRWVIPPSPWLDSNAILVFTNVVTTWSDEALASIIDTMPRFSEVFVDLKLFGKMREEDAERTALFDRIAASARSAERLPELASGSHFARFVFGAAAAAVSAILHAAMDLMTIADDVLVAML
jgi:hypothetical protein